MSRAYVCTRCGHRSDHHNAFGTMPCAACDCARLRIAVPKSEPKSRIRDTSFKAFLGDAKRCEQAAREVLRQCEVFRQNGAGDEVRALWVRQGARKAIAAAERMARRYEALP